MAHSWVNRHRYICGVIQVLAYSPGAPILQHSSLALARSCDCSSVRWCAVAVALFHDSFVGWSNGWPALRRNLGSLDGSTRRDDIGVLRLYELSRIILARSPKASVHHDSHCVLVCLLRKAPYQGPVIERAKVSTYLDGFPVSQDFGYMIESRSGMTLRKNKSAAGVVLIGLSVVCLLFFGMRRESVRVSQRVREAILRTDLHTIRDAIDSYTLDKGQPPKSLQDLVGAGYLRSIPVDPMTGKTDWVPDFEGPVLGDPIIGPDLKARLCDAHSNSTRAATEGSQYNTW